MNEIVRALPRLLEFRRALRVQHPPPLLASPPIVRPSSIATYLEKRGFHESYCYLAFRGVDLARIAGPLHAGVRGPAHQAPATRGDERAAQPIAARGCSSVLP